MLTRNASLIDANCARVMEEKTGLRSVSLLLSTSFELLHVEALQGLKQILSQGKFEEQIADSSVVEDMMRALPSASPAVQVSMVEIMGMLMKSGNEKILASLRTPESRQALESLEESQRTPLLAQLDA